MLISAMFHEFVIIVASMISEATLKEKLFFSSIELFYFVILPPIALLRNIAYYYNLINNLIK